MNRNFERNSMRLPELIDQLTGKSIENQLRKILALFPGKVVFTTSFGIEDQVISHIVFENNIPVEVVTLDTGRLFQETYTVFNKTVKKYQKKIKVYFPDHEAIEKMMTEKGPFKFYPLFNWSFEEVENFIKVNNVPYNVLHDRGFVSIGCEPCTRAVAIGEDFRSGRWWGETDGKKECGFHIKRSEER